MIDRLLFTEVLDCLKGFPAVAILGPRQCGKSTLAHSVLTHFSNSVYLDLESPSDLNKLNEPELFFTNNSQRLVCLDEVQRKPDLFAVLRSVIDRNKRNGQFLILGSASPKLLKQTSESLAGRIAFLELTPFVINEVSTLKDNRVNQYHLLGGYPRSFLAGSEKQSFRWRSNFIRTFLERDIPALGINLPPQQVYRLWQILAHYHGQLMNYSKIGESLGVSHVTVRKYIDILTSTYMVRELPPYVANTKKRLVKSPKFYIRDSGILHALLSINDYNSLLGHPVFGASWEGIVIENVLANQPDYRGFFYRTSDGTEIDLVLERGLERIGIECKASMSPKPARGFWNSLRTVNIDRAFVVAPVENAYPIADNVVVTPPTHDFFRTLEAEMD